MSHWHLMWGTEGSHYMGVMYDSVLEAAEVAVSYLYEIYAESYPGEAEELMEGIAEIGSLSTRDEPMSYEFDGKRMSLVILDCYDNCSDVTYN